jgi:hypothetical protein
MRDSPTWASCKRAGSTDSVHSQAIQLQSCKMKQWHSRLLVSVNVSLDDQTVVHSSPFERNRFPPSSAVNTNEHTARMNAEHVESV